MSYKGGASSMVEEQLVVFRLGKEEYAISISQVREIIHYQGATKLPNTPDYTQGIINLRGKIIPVIDLAMRFNLETEKVSDRRAIIIETVDQEFAIIVDEVTEVKKLQESAIDVVQEIAGGGNDYLRGVGKDSGGRLLILLNAERILSPKELELLKEVC
jgi:purine-binding chemotaxis protein CheW